MRTYRLILFSTLLAGAVSGATFTVSNTDDSGPGSLRQAILDANAAGGLDLIEFDVDAGFAQDISLLSPLPAISDPVVIDGYTESNAEENDSPTGYSGQILIGLDGTDAGGSADGLTLNVGGCTIRGLAIQNFGGAGIRVNAGGNLIEGNIIGLAPSGFFDAPNGIGVFIGSSSNQVGGPLPAARNTISGNNQGLVIAGPAATDNWIQGNLIGTDVFGVFELNDEGIGLLVSNATDNVIGGGVEGAGNVISGNATGLHFAGAGSSNNWVEGNFIGVGLQPALDVPNGIGVLLAGARANTIGGSTSAVANVISGNEVVGVRLDGGASDNLISANFIGVTQTTGGRFIIDNVHAIEIANAHSNQVGGTIPAAANIIGGNSTHGIYVRANASDNWIQGNFIGTDETGAEHPNAGDGLRVFGTRTLVGGTAAGAGNVIAHNGSNGITISNLYNTVLANLIFSNAVLGIDLGQDGVTLNDTNDVDTGANQLQNFPVLARASSCSGISIEGALNSAPNTDYEVEFFRNDACDPSGYGEGQELIGWTNVTTDAQGNALFQVSFTNEIMTGGIITGTATDALDGNTSEFSACLEVDRVLCVDIERDADENCRAVVLPDELDEGTLDPCGGPVTITVDPIGPYPLGTNLVTVTATSTNGFTNSCVARVIVADLSPPAIEFPNELQLTAGPFASDRVVFYNLPWATDNCTVAGIITDPPNGSTFPLGTNVVTWTAIDGFGNTTNQTFNLIILPFGTVEHDLAIVKMKAPKRITLKPTRTTRTGSVKLQVQNRSAHDEVITDFAMLQDLVSLEVRSLGSCDDLTAVLVDPGSYPITVASRKKLNVVFNVTFGCANDPAKGDGHYDFLYRARVNRAAIDGEPDGHPDDDYGPRKALPLGVDANPNGKIKDRGCGGKFPDKTLGAAVLTDVVIK